MRISATTSIAAAASIAVPAAASNDTSHFGAPTAGGGAATAGSVNSEWGFIISALLLRIGRDQEVMQENAVGTTLSRFACHPSLKRSPKNSPRFSRGGVAPQATGRCGVFLLCPPPRLLRRHPSSMRRGENSYFPRGG